VRPKAQIAIGDRAFEPREKMSNFSVSLLIVIVMPMSPMMLPLVIMIPMTAVMLPVFMLLPLPSAVLPIPRIVVVFVVARSHPVAALVRRTCPVADVPDVAGTSRIPISGYPCVAGTWARWGLVTDHRRRRRRVVIARDANAYTDGNVRLGKQRPCREHHYWQCFTFHKVIHLPPCL